MSIQTLISHRFRGFSDQENTIEGLLAALDFGVQHLEFDIRVAKCGTPMIYHDEYAGDGENNRQTLNGVMANDYPKLGGRFNHIPRADDMFAAIASHANRTAKFWVDIKDAGFEAEIHALICLYRLQDRVIYVSWVPECLYALHRLTPQTPLCLSHWCQNPSLNTRKIHTVYRAKNGHVPNSGRKYIHGERSGWFIDGPLQGALREILIASQGAVCVPQNMVTADLVRYYHTDGIQVSTFAYTDISLVNTHQKNFNIDLYMIDNKDVFENL